MPKGHQLSPARRRFATTAIAAIATACLGTSVGPAAETLNALVWCDDADPADDYASMKRPLDHPVRLVHGGHFPSYGGTRHRAITRAWLGAKDAR